MHVSLLLLCVALSLVAAAVLRDVSVKRLAPHEDDILNHGSVEAAREAQAADPRRPHQLHVLLRGMGRGARLCGAWIGLTLILLTRWPGIAPWKAVVVVAVALGCYALPAAAARQPILVAYAKSRGIAVKSLKRRGRARTNAIWLVLLFWPGVLAIVVSRTFDVRLALILAGYAGANPVLAALLAGLAIRMAAPEVAPPDVAERVARLAIRCDVRVGTTRIVSTRARRMANASQYGWLPGLKFLAISDYLIDEITGPELDATIAHELAHARLRHCLVRDLVTWVIVAAFWIMILDFATGANEGVALGALAAVLMLGLMGPSMVVRQEVAADDLAARVVGPTAVASGLTRLAAINGIDANTSPKWDKQVGHPGIARRVARLEGQVAGNVGTAPPVTRHASGS